MRGHLHPEREWKGSEVAACLARRKCLCCGLVIPPLHWPPGPAGLPPPPGWDRVNTAAGSPGYLYQGLGAGPVPTAAPALPCPPQPAPSQRGTSRRGDIPQMQPPFSPEATGLVAQDASNFTEDAQLPLPWKH